MTTSQALRYVREHQDDDPMDLDDLREVFTAIFQREPEAQDEEEGLWSHVVSASTGPTE